MKCLERETLFAYACRLLEGREEAEARAHVEACADCRSVVEDYGRLEAVLDEWKPRAPSPWFDARLRAALAVEEEGPFASLLAALNWRKWLVPAVVVAGVVFAIVVTISQRTPPAPAPVARQEAPLTEPTPSPAEAPAPQRGPARVQSRSSATNLPAPREEKSLSQDFESFDDFDLIANFDVLSELPARGGRAVN
jgi:hypothetical protein